MSDSKTRSQDSSTRPAVRSNSRKAETAATSVKPADKRPSWKETFPFYSGLLEIV